MNIEEILKKHVGEDGKLNVEAAAKELKEEQGKAFVPKADFNSKNEELKTANDTLNKLQKDNKDVEALQTTIADYEAQVEKLTAERAEERKSYAIKEALQRAGANDVEYLMFKLGDVEVNKDGTIKDLDNKVKSLKELNPNFFAEDEKEKDNDPNAPGYQVIDNKLDNGKKSVAYSFDQLKTLSTEEINQNWDAVSAALEKGDDK